MRQRSGAERVSEAVAMREDLAARDAGGAFQTAEVEPQVAQLRIVRPAPARAPEPYLVLRLRRGPHPRMVGRSECSATQSAAFDQM